LSPEESYELLNSIKTKEKLDKINFRDFLMKDDVNLLHHLSGVVEQENILKKITLIIKYRTLMILLH
jgi:hypothetical protein